MKEFIAQIRNGIPYPASDNDRDVIMSEYKQNQLIKCRATAISKGIEPSVAQNNTLHACFQLVADNKDDPQFDTKEKVKFRTKVALHFIYEDRIAVRPDGTVQFDYRSFSFAELKNMERLRVFDRAFEYLADLLGITVDKLVAEAKKRMRTY